MHKRIDSKADQKLIVENQQRFFQDLQKVEEASDQSMTKMVSDELKKLQEKVFIDNQVLDKKIQALKNDFDKGKGRSQPELDTSLVQVSDDKIKKIWKQVERNGQDVKRIEVILYLSL